MPDLRKIRVPDGALRVEIDEPLNHCIEKPVGVLRGWFAARDEEIPETFHFQVGGITLPHSIEQRMDVKAAMPDHIIVGFKIRYDLFFYLQYIQDNRLVIHLMLPGYDQHLLRFRIQDSALAICLAAAGDT